MAITPIAGATAAPVTAGLLQLSQGANAAQVAQQAAAQSAPLASFQQFFADAVSQTNNLQNQAQESQRRLLIGESDDLHGVMIAMEKADMAFQLTMAVRNKVIDAYQEVMRMQI
jgi:flagellar hook-basal body complex protein FliE